MPSLQYASKLARWNAVRSRDTAAEYHFVYCVKTTKIYCRPTCKARLARRANVEFFDTGPEAVAAGYRACKRCQPDVEKFVPEADKSIEKIRDMLDKLPEDAPLPKLEELAADAGLSRYHFHRIFKKTTGSTPREYALSKRQYRQNSLAGERSLALTNSSISTPALVSDAVNPSTAMATPEYSTTPDFALNEWLQGPDDPILFEDYLYPFGSADGNINTIIPAQTTANSSKGVSGTELVTLQVYFSTVETTHGVLLIAFEEAQTSFPAPFYTLLPIEQLPDEQRLSVQQHTFALVEALETPIGRSLNRSAEPTRNAMCWES